MVPATVAETGAVIPSTGDHLAAPAPASAPAPAPAGWEPPDSVLRSVGCFRRASHNQAITASRSSLAGGRRALFAEECDGDGGGGRAVFVASEGRPPGGRPTPTPDRRPLPAAPHSRTGSTDPHRRQERDRPAGRCAPAADTHVTGCDPPSCAEVAPRSPVFCRGQGQSAPCPGLTLPGAAPALCDGVTAQVTSNPRRLAVTDLDRHRL